MIHDITWRMTLQHQVPEPELSTSSKYGHKGSCIFQNKNWTTPLLCTLWRVSDGLWLAKMLMVPDQVYVVGRVILDVMDHLSMWFLTCVPNFSFLVGLEVGQEHLSSISILGWCWWFLIRYVVDRIILDVTDNHIMWFLTCVPNFSSLAWIEVGQEPLSFMSILGGCWRFLMSNLADWLILEVMDHHSMKLFTCVPNFSSLLGLEVGQEPLSSMSILGGCWWL